ncbi:hypothetical protein LHL20_16985 [Alteromonas sp. McT4-15]|uniref:hypothetical protein n=1 Tax=Alteromonas sp. McT4-15 TaxID=2881256 RepID=UPI001CF8C1CC|nr:hypothetical protein [Alteromonas sp. McT4-15]MCB4437928.1 hypothetical protein [Alteromonas sp. McT4-15]
MKKFSIYLIAIVICCVVSLEIGIELITQITLYTNGWNSNERHLLADDLGFGILLFMGLLPELVLGFVYGVFLGKKINKKVTVA